MTVQRLCELLKGMCKRVTVVDEAPSCSLLACEYERGRLWLIAYAEYQGRPYVKVVPESCLAGSWSCSNVFYTPYGVYVFATSLEELVRRIEEKKPRLVLAEKLAELQTG